MDDNNLMEVEMKSAAKIVFLGIALVWMHGATAATAAAGNNHSKPAARVPVKAQPHKVDRKRIEMRMQQRSARTHARTEAAEKDVAERKAKTQQPASSMQK